MGGEALVLIESVAIADGESGDEPAAEESAEEAAKKKRSHLKVVK